MGKKDFQNLLDFLGENGPDFTKPLPDVRVDFDKMTGAFPLADGYSTTSVKLNNIDALDLRPSSGAVGSTVVFYLHGGGFIVGSARGYQGIASAIAKKVNGRAVVVDYRLAPETPFPGAPDDALAAYKALLNEGVAARDIVMVGDSAGGGLSLVTLSAIRAAGLDLPAAAVLISPWVDLSQGSDAMRTKADADISLSHEALSGMAAAYLGDHPVSDPRVAPLNNDFMGFPPLQIQVGSDEVLIDDAISVAAKAGHENIVVDLKIWPGMVHDWPLFAHILEDGRRAIDDAVSFLKQHLAARRADEGLEPRP